MTTANRPSLPDGHASKEYADYMLDTIDSVYNMALYCTIAVTILVIVFIIFAVLKYLERKELKALKAVVVKFTGVASGILGIIEGWIDVHIREAGTVADKAREVAQGLEERLPKATAEEVVNTIQARESSHNLPIRPIPE